MAKSAKKPDPAFMTHLGSAVRAEFAKEAAAKARSARPAPRLPAPAATGAAAKKTATAKSAAKPKPAAKKPATKAAKPATKAGAAKSAATRGKTGTATSSAARSASSGLLKELRELLPRLDEAGLEFLLEQARVHLYNMESAKLDVARTARQAKASAPAGPAGAGGGLRLERSASGASYYVWAGGDSTMFTAEEMVALVRIAHGRDGDLEAGRAIGAWLERERRDALEGLRLPGLARPALVELAALLRSKFRKPGAS